jgi:biotin carboxyl carrier protein
MNYKEIQAIIKNFEKSNMTKLELTTDEFSIKLSKLNEVTTNIVSTNKVDENLKANGDSKIENNHFELKSPLVGTFYASNSPNGKPFVQVGDIV